MARKFSINEFTFSMTATDNWLVWGPADLDSIGAISVDSTEIFKAFRNGEQIGEACTLLDAARLINAAAERDQSEAAA